jgi:hypothetical protein
LFRGAPERPGGNRDVNPPSVRLEHPAGLVLTRIRTSYAHGWRAWPCACQSAHVAGPGATVPGVVQFGMPGDPQFCRDQARRCADMSAVTKNAEMRKLVEDLAVKWLPRAILEANKEYKPQPRRYVDYVFSRGFAHASHCRQAVSNCALASSSVGAWSFVCTLGGLPTTPYNVQNQRMSGSPRSS